MNIKKEVLKSQESLKKINIERSSIIVKAKFGPSKETKIPLDLEQKLSFFVACIIGDGHLKKGKYQISIELSNLVLLNYINKICLGLFDRSFNVRQIKRNGRKQTYAIYIDSKAIYFLLNKVFEIPFGKKSDIVVVPKLIFNSNKKIKSAFLLGIMATEGGRRKRVLDYLLLAEICGLD